MAVRSDRHAYQKERCILRSDRYLEEYVKVFTSTIWIYANAISRQDKEVRREEFCSAAGMGVSSRTSYSKIGLSFGDV